MENSLTIRISNNNEDCEYVRMDLLPSRADLALICRIVRHYQANIGMMPKVLLCNTGDLIERYNHLDDILSKMSQLIEVRLPSPKGGWNNKENE